MTKTVPIWGTISPAKGGVVPLLPKTRSPHTPIALPALAAFRFRPASTGDKARQFDQHLVPVGPPARPVHRQLRDGLELLKDQKRWKNGPKKNKKLGRFVGQIWTNPLCKKSPCFSSFLEFLYSFEKNGTHLSNKTENHMVSKRCFRHLSSSDLNLKTWG